MNNKDITNKKLTIHGLSELKLGSHLSSLVNPRIGAIAVKKRKIVHSVFFYTYLISSLIILNT